MVGRVLEVETDGRHLARDRGFLVVSAGREELGRVPLDDLAAVVANAHGLTYSNNLLLELARRGVPTVLCARAIGQRRSSGRSTAITLSPAAWATRSRPPRR